MPRPLLFQDLINNRYAVNRSPLILLIILGINNEKMNREIENKTLKDISSGQLSDAQTS